jgi:hypothetical protein
MTVDCNNRLIFFKKDIGILNLYQVYVALAGLFSIETAKLGENRVFCTSKTIMYMLIIKIKHILYNWRQYVQSQRRKAQKHLCSS